MRNPGLKKKVAGTFPNSEPEVAGTFLDLTLKPIGIFKSEQIEPYQAGKQPDDLGLPGQIHLNSGDNLELALQDINGCSHLWIIFGFHFNQNWKPLVQPPRSQKKIGVFATRAPYRPNPLGLSLVPLMSVDHLTLHVGANDILNGSPVYDIKPYHPEFDSAQNAHIHWLENSKLPQHQITFSPFAESQLEFLSKYHLKEIRPFITRQLEFDPTNKNKKRVTKGPHFWTLCYRTWRIDFTTSENIIAILSIRSGYSEQELFNIEDKYSDKDIHRAFVKEFS